MPLRKTIRPLTGLRAVAAYAVLLAHIVSWTVGRSDPAIQLISERLAYFGISLFFVLSGFVMEYNYIEKVSSGDLRQVYNFLVARFARLYPLYAAVMIYFLWDSGNVDALYLTAPILCSCI
jgi:peptidoglycan/LPS O-acetylase OafA/YrhL